MKFTTEELQSLLKSIGIADVEIVEEGSDFNQDEVLTAIDAARSSILKPKHRAEMLEELTGQATRMTDAAITKKLKALTGIDGSELKDLTYEEKIEKAFEHSKGVLGKDAEGLRGKINELTQLVSDKDAEWEAKYNADISLEKAKYTERDVIEYIAGELKDLPLPDDADRMVLAKDLYRYAKDNSHVHWDESQRRVEYRTLDNKEMPMTKDNMPITTKHFAEEKFKPLGSSFWQTDMRNKKPDPSVGEQYKKPEGSGFDKPSTEDPLEAFNKQREALFNE